MTHVNICNCGDIKDVPDSCDGKYVFWGDLHVQSAPLQKGIAQLSYWFWCWASWATEYDAPAKYQLTKIKPKSISPKESGKSLMDSLMTFLKQFKTSTARAELSWPWAWAELRLDFLKLWNRNKYHKIELCAKFQLDGLSLSWNSCQTAVKTANNSCYKIWNSRILKRVIKFSRVQNFSWIGWD